VTLLPESEHPAIRVHDLSVTYRMNAGGLPTLRNRLSPKTRKYAAPKKVEALKHVSFDVAEGQVLGIIGHNGAGKSTLLRTIAGILPPTDGFVEVRGEVSTLLSLGIGMIPDLSGRENCYLAGLASGMTRAEIDDKFDEIHDFSGLGDFIEAPMRSYSSGMASRLAFSVAVHMTPDILLIDEALSAGDAAFKNKAAERMDQLMSEARTMIVVSHALGTLEEMCSEILWLDHGQVVDRGNPTEMVNAYTESLSVKRSKAVMEDL
jgi:ABC-type polysaccharide/polyol phosphate transport system ATPase subunit